MVADPESTEAGRRRALSRFAVHGLTLAVLGTVMAMLAGWGTRWGMWDFRTGFSILKWGGYGAVAGLILSLIGAFFSRPGRRRRGFSLALLGMVVAGTTLILLLGWIATANRVPRIHDISTDTDNPPQFDAILPLRAEAPNSATYDDPKVAAQQRAAYPDLAPLILNLSPEEAYERALAAAESFGWEIVSTEPTQGRIEATDTTFWFGFKDDVVVRIREESGGSRIDVRSLSRVGKSDVGTNAARIRAYLERVASSSS